MSEKYIEKIFLYLFILSLILHAGVITLVILFPEKKKEAAHETYMVELRDLPLPEPAAPARGKGAEKKEQALTPQPAPRETVRTLPPPAQMPLMPPPSGPQKGVEEAPQRETVRKAPSQEAPSGESLVRRRRETGPDLAKLFPSGKGMAAIEDKFRKKYGVKVGGDTLFLDNDDDLLGSFSRRFIEAVRGRWRVVGRQLLMNNETGYGLLLISINRKGEIEDVHVVETSGNKRVDEEIIRTVKTAGYVGPLPRKWPYDRVQGYYIYSAGYEIQN